jgi:type II secretory pathway pseudopilin PulG
MRRRGFSLLETLIVLGFSLLVLMAAFEFIGITKSLFLKLKEAQETNQAFHAALIKLRIDLLRAGFGLGAPLRAGAIEGIEITGTSLLILSQEEAFALSADALSGERRISLEKVSGLNPGRRICLAEKDKAEIHGIASLAGQTVVLSEPLEAAYSVATAQLILLEEVLYFLDDRSGILRRKVNTSPAQPLLDNTGLFVPVYQREENLARVILADKKNLERTYGLSVFPKNLGFVLP